MPSANEQPSRAPDEAAREAAAEAALRVAREGWASRSTPAPELVAFIRRQVNAAVDRYLEVLEEHGLGLVDLAKLNERLERGRRNSPGHGLDALRRELADVAGTLERALADLPVTPPIADTRYDRIDRIVLRDGRLEWLAGTPTAGADLGNMAGAPELRPGDDLKTTVHVPPNSGMPGRRNAYLDHDVPGANEVLVGPADRCTWRKGDADYTPPPPAEVDWQAGTPSDGVAELAEVVHEGTGWPPSRRNRPVHAGYPGAVGVTGEPPRETLRDTRQEDHRG